jgi:hypothetical protein
MYHTAPSVQALTLAQLRLDSICIQGHFTLEVQTVSRPYLLSTCSGVTEIHYMALSEHAPQAVQDRVQSVCNEGHFALEAKKIFLSPLALQLGD